MKFPSYVYAIQHNTTKRIYVGMTIDMQSRIKAHLACLRGNKHTNKLMQKDFNEHGEDYSFYKLDTVNEFSERYKESDWMDELNSRVRSGGYNYRDKKGTAERIKIIDGVPEVK